MKVDPERGPRGGHERILSEGDRYRTSLLIRDG